MKWNHSDKVPSTMEMDRNESYSMYNTRTLTQRIQFATATTSWRLIGETDSGFWTGTRWKKQISKSPSHCKHNSNHQLAQSQYGESRGISQYGSTHKMHFLF